MSPGYEPLADVRDGSWGRAGLRFSVGSTVVRDVISRPFVYLNMAMTADGKIATANRAVTSFGSARDAEHLYELRAGADAILCGARTLIETKATLGNGAERYSRTRRRNGLADYPIRVVVTGSGSLPSSLPLWTTHPSPIVVLTTEKAPEVELNRLRALASAVWVSPGGDVDFLGAFARLREEFKVHRLLGEGGATVNEALFRGDLVDELHLTLCPFLAAGREAPTIVAGRGDPTLAAAARLELVRRTLRDNEMFLVYKVIRGDRPPPGA